MSYVIPAGPAVLARPTKGSVWPTRLMLLFFATSLVVPASLANKVIFLPLAFRCLLDVLLVDRSVLKKTKTPFIVFGIFTYGFALAWLDDFDRGLARQFYIATFILFLFYYLHRYRIDMDRIARISGIIMFFGTAAFLYSRIFAGQPVAAALSKMFMNAGQGTESERDYLGFALPALHLGASPFFFIPFCLWSISFFKTPKLSTLGLMLGALICLVLSGSRGPVMICVLFLCYLTVARFSLAGRLFAFVTVAVLLYYVVYVYLGNTQVFAAREGSNAAKIGHLISYVDDLTVPSALLGRGLATFYYSTGAGVMKAHTEITPLDMARYFGIPLMFVLYFVLLFPTTRIRDYVGKNAPYVVIFLLYLVLSATNPVLFNSYGLLIVLWYWSKVIPLDPPRYRLVRKESS